MKTKEKDNNGLLLENRILVRFSLFTFFIFHHIANLAAWSRLKHPELISGALASSAPILAMMDFYGTIYIVHINHVLVQVISKLLKMILKRLEENVLIW